MPLHLAQRSFLLFTGQGCDWLGWCDYWPTRDRLQRSWRNPQRKVACSPQPYCPNSGADHSWTWICEPRARGKTELVLWHTWFHQRSTGTRNAYHWPGLCKEALCGDLVAIFHVARNTPKLGMPNLVIKYVPILFCSTSGESSLQTCAWKHPPPPHVGNGIRTHTFYFAWFQLLFKWCISKLNYILLIVVS